MGVLVGDQFRSMDPWILFQWIRRTSNDMFVGRKKQKWKIVSKRLSLRELFSLQQGVKLEF